MATRVIKVKASQVRAARIQLATLEAADLEPDAYLVRLASVTLRSDSTQRS